MSLELRKNSKWWYGVFIVNGQKTVINLGVPTTGKRPRKRTMIGDDEFERSRGRALKAYEEQRRKNEADRTGEKALTKLAEMTTGVRSASRSSPTCPRTGRTSRDGRPRMNGTPTSAGCGWSSSRHGWPSTNGAP